MYAAIGYGGILMSRIMPKVRDEYAKLCKTEDTKTAFDVPIAKEKSSDGVIVEGLDNCLVRFAHCCNPLPGDEIIGFITRGQGVSIHKRDCRNVTAAHYLDENSLRWVRVSWSANVRESFKATLDINCMDRDGLIADVSTQLSNMHIPIYAMNVRTTNDGRVYFVTTVGISNTEHLKTVMQKLRKISDVLTVERQV